MYFEEHRSQLQLDLTSNGPHIQTRSATRPDDMSDAEAYDLSHFFVVDSFNIHRLVIAGVTCASKFFSDVFYTNSRYAKVSILDEELGSTLKLTCSRWEVCH